MFTRPIACAASNTSRGKRASRSHSAAMGMIRSRAKRRAVSTRAFCSSLNEKSSIDSLLRSASPPFVLFPHGARAEQVSDGHAHQDYSGNIDDVLEGHAARLPAARL